MLTMTKPTIHLNGTHPETLEDQLAQASVALRLAALALGEACPNGRDYYPQGPHALAEALAEHDSRVRAILRVREEIEALLEHVTDVRQIATAN